MSPQQARHSSTLYWPRRVCRCATRCRCARAALKVTAVTKFCCAQPCVILKRPNLLLARWALQRAPQRRVCNSLKGHWPYALALLARFRVNNWFWEPRALIARARRTILKPLIKHLHRARRWCTLACCCSVLHTITRLQCCLSHNTISLSADCATLRCNRPRTMWCAHWHKHAQPRFRSSSKLRAAVSPPRRAELQPTCCLSPRPPLTIFCPWSSFHAWLFTIIHSPAE